MQLIHGLSQLCLSLQGGIEISRWRQHDRWLLSGGRRFGAAAATELQVIVNSDELVGDLIAVSADSYGQIDVERRSVVAAAAAAIN